VSIPECVKNAISLKQLKMSVNSIIKPPQDESFFSKLTKLEIFSIAFNPIPLNSLFSCSSISLLPSLTLFDVRGIKMDKESQVSFFHSFLLFFNSRLCLRNLQTV
jgi:hypothetical protein